MSLTKQQLKDRKQGLFGTDASMLDGTNVYHDEYYLYKVKRGGFGCCCVCIYLFGHYYSHFIQVNLIH